MIFYVSPYKLVKTLAEIIQYFGAERNVCVSRELSKLYEENQRGMAQDVLKHYEKNTPKGEIVLIVNNAI